MRNKESYKFYVYVAPGHIKYFDDVRKARDYAEFYQSKVVDVRDDEVLFDFEGDDESDD
jgi:hypothetical protein